MQLEIDKLAEISQKLKAIAHPLRIAIINLLQDNEQLSVTEICVRLNLEQATTSHHLGLLKYNGVLVSMRNGKNTFYKLKNCSISKIIECLSV